MKDALIERALARLMEVPHLQCGSYPTPLVEAKRLGTTLGGPRIFIKHDDLTGPGYGGNKVRKLEYVLAQALADEAEFTITVGAETSNHARITAALAARLGLRSILVLNRLNHDETRKILKPATPYLADLFGSDIHFVETRDERVPTMQAIANELRFAGRRVAEIPLGASIPLGALGYVRAAQELAQQLASQDLAVNYIFHASSSGGTQAGLLVGCYLAGLKTRIIGVSPDEPSGAIEAEVSTIVKGLVEMLEMAEDGPYQSPVVLDQFIGPGYGIASPESEAAIKLLARTEGVLLDPAYTSKAMAALISWIQEGRLTARDNVVFWHTGGQIALFGAER